MRADVDGSLIRKQWVCAESLARNFMKFQSRVEIVRSYLRNFIWARSRSRRRETIDSAAHYRENFGPDVTCERDALHSSAAATYEISHVNCTHRASYANTLVVVCKMGYLIKFGCD